MSIRTPGPSGGRKRVIVPGAGAKPRAGSSAFSRISSAWPRRGARPVRASRSPAAIRSCSRTMSTPVTSSLTGCSTCRRAFSSMKWNVPSVAEQELERARVLVADRAAGSLGGRLHLLARLRVERGRRRLLDQLLVAALDRALALAESEHAAVLVAEHLDLDMPRGDERLLEVERPVREGCFRLDARGRVGGLELVRPVHEPHPLAAAARDGLQQHGEAELARGRPHLGERRAALGAGHERHVGGLHLRLRLRLVAHPLHHVRAGADEDEVVRPRRRGRRPGSRRGSRSRDAPPRSRSSRRRRSRSGSGDSSPTPTAGRCRPRGRRAGHGASRRRPSSRPRPPRRRARGRPGSPGRRSRRGSLRGPG